MNQISEGLYFVGVDDEKIDLFEGILPVEHGMSYNSYVICGQKTAVIDSVDAHFGDKWLKNVEQALGGKKPDYIVVLHMEPDHSANIFEFTQKYPEAIVVGNNKTFVMLGEFFGTEYAERRIVVKDGDSLDLGGRTLKFIFAPMVHWPEVMTLYDEKSKTLFSADAFGKFGALSHDEEWKSEAQRYYFAIVGKYGVQVQALLKKLSAYEICAICPLHGPVLKENLGYYLGLYNKWSAYEPTKDGVLIAYSSVYGHTKAAVQMLAVELEKRGIEAEICDLVRTERTVCISKAFEYSAIVLATTTYNGEMFPAMREFLDCLTERNFKNRIVGLMENGSWAPFAAKAMLAKLENCKDLKFAEPFVKIRSAINAQSEGEIKSLAGNLSALLKG